MAGGVLAAWAGQEAKLNRVAGGANHLLLLELAADSRAMPQARPAVEFLLRTLPEQRVAELLRLEQVTAEDKIAVLVRQVIAQEHLPPGCESLWDEALQAGESARPTLLSQVLLQLEAAYAGSVRSAKCPPKHNAAFVLALLAASARIPLNVPP